jgi:prephenate dehydrogenase
MGSMDILVGKTVAIVGLGLMGGSLALALRGHGIRLVAIELDEATRALALERRVVDEATAVLEEGLRGAELAVLAAPVGAILSLLSRLPEACPNGCIVLDLGSTKEAIVAAMDRLPPAFRAVGGHPMCGKEVAGLAAAEAGLFAGQTFILCRSRRSDREAQSVAEAMVAAVGARPLWLAPDQHDRLVAQISHLPYFVAAALMADAALAAQSSDYLWQVSASGFHDTTRLAGSDPRMMRDIALTNRPAILAALLQYRRRLDEVLALLEKGDEDVLYQWLAARQAEHAAYVVAKSVRPGVNRG